MIDILEILRCPETHQTLSLADAGTLAAVNKRIADGSACNKAGLRVTEPLAEGLARADGHVLYPVREEIPILLADEAIPL